MKLLRLYPLEVDYLGTERMQHIVLPHWNELLLRLGRTMFLCAHHCTSLYNHFARITLARLDTEHAFLFPVESEQ